MQTSNSHHVGKRICDILGNRDDVEVYGKMEQTVYIHVTMHSLSLCEIEAFYYAHVEMEGLHCDQSPSSVD
jgi:hypothetical protein